MARAFARVGFVYKRYGHDREAEEMSLKAVELFQQLALEFPTEPEYRRALADSQLELVHYPSNVVQAEEKVRQAITIYLDLEAESPNDIQYAVRRVLASNVQVLAPAR